MLSLSETPFLPSSLLFYTLATSHFVTKNPTEPERQHLGRAEVDKEGVAQFVKTGACGQDSLLTHHILWSKGMYWCSLSFLLFALFFHSGALTHDLVLFSLSQAPDPLANPFLESPDSRIQRCASSVSRVVLTIYINHPVIFFPQD